MQFDEKKQKKALIKAEKLAEDFDAEEAEAFAQKHKGTAWYDSFIILYNMVTDSDFKLSKQAYLTIAGALAYVVLPIDIIPDFIPGVGFIDDVFVIGFVMKSLSDEIERFKLYKEKV